MIVEHSFPLLEALERPGELTVVVEASASLGVRPLVASAVERLAVRPWGVEFADLPSGQVA